MLDVGQRVHPVEPDPPGVDVGVGEHEAAQKQQHQEEEGAGGGGDVLIAPQAGHEPEHAQPHGVDGEQDQHEGEKSAEGKGGHTANNSQ